jgi:signal transduction histidine kinase
MDKSRAPRANSAASTTAPPLSASSPGDPAAASARLLAAVARLVAPEGRAAAAGDLAALLGAEDLLIFVRDPELDILLPAPGFPATLPDGRAWQGFLHTCVSAGRAEAALPYPGVSGARCVRAVAAGSQCVLALVGGAPAADALTPLTLIAPLLTAAFRGEQAARIAQSQAELARGAAAQARTMATALETARQELQAALRVRDQFLSVAAHELKTPLTVLLGYTQVLQRRAAREHHLDARDEHALQVIAARAVKLHHLIDDLLDVTRIQTGRLALDLRPLDLCALAARLVDELQPGLERHTLVLRCPEREVWINADEQRIDQAVQNLLDNAVKYSPAGGQIAIEVTRTADQAELTVRDQGMGVPPGAQQKIFERFFRAGNTNRDHITGMGIGLYVVREIMAQHGGEVRLASVEHRGSAFTLAFPAPRTSPPQPPPLI